MRYACALQSNTFQAILTTDGYRTHVIYLYDSDSLQWSGPSLDPRAQSGQAVMGFNAPSRFYSDSRSGTGSIAQLGSVVDPSNQYLLMQSFLSGSAYVFKLYDDNSESGPRVQCLQWFARQPDPANWTSELLPCPPLLRQAENDPRFRISDRSSTHPCYTSVTPTSSGAGRLEYNSYVSHAEYQTGERRILFQLSRGVCSPSLVMSSSLICIS